MLGILLPIVIGGVFLAIALTGAYSLATGHAVKAVAIYFGLAIFLLIAGGVLLALGIDLVSEIEQ